MGGFRRESLRLSPEPDPLINVTVASRVKAQNEREHVEHVWGGRTVGGGVISFGGAAGRA